MLSTLTENGSTEFVKQTQKTDLIAVYHFTNMRKCYHPSWSCVFRAWQQHLFRGTKVATKIGSTTTGYLLIPDDALDAHLDKGDIVLLHDNFDRMASFPA
jgi:hypothetical protein